MTASDGIARDVPVTRDEVASLFTVNTCFGTTAERAAQPARDGTPCENLDCSELSVRALNVLKLLAAEMTGECPTKKDWLPSASFLQGVTFECLAKARNCGPLTIAEIIRWADARGVAITPPFHAGKSLSETWRCLETKFATGDLTESEVIEALQWSVRRRSVKIPLGVQRILMKLLNRASKRPRRA